MVEAKIIGGLGNQLFQYATAKNLARLNNTSLYLYLGWYYQDFHSTNTTPRVFDLSNFNAKFKNAEGITHRFLNKIYKSLDYNERSSFQYDPNLMRLRHNNIKLSGYWGSFLYFDEIKEDLQKEITPKLINDENINLIKQIQNTNSVSLHIRRGDYLSSDLYHILDINYYKSAISLIKNKISDPVFYVFSDDVEYMKMNFGNCNYKYIDINKGINSYMDLYLMSLCQHNIIANSTFSAWGAYLNINQNKIVIAPENWYNLDKIHSLDKGFNSSNKLEILPLNWIRI